MTPPLCAVLIPTRQRVGKCIQCVTSFVLHASGREDFEILLRLDDDDPDLNLYRDALESPKVKYIIGPRGAGYGRVSAYFTELAKTTDAKWVMQFNDDATIQGPWLAELEKVPIPALAVCEWHKLGLSNYRHDEGGPFPILPNGFWLKDGWDSIGEPPDKWSIRMAKKLGWPTVYLPGVSFHHVRDEEEMRRRG